MPYKYLTPALMLLLIILSVTIATPSYACACEGENPSRISHLLENISGGILLASAVIFPIVMLRDRLKK